ncbi:hypothetical protein [Terriglobus tenax]|uniref:hypothetical protein n=1 Tax=Terriglobus tenax TaxID=1111115 RepID=UPI0021E091C0|nr:hypothetical protein [Terriglobus tenax]
MLRKTILAAVMTFLAVGIAEARDTTPKAHDHTPRVKDRTPRPHGTQSPRRA